MTIVTGDIIALSTGGVLEISDSPIPNAPTITSVVDNGDQDSITSAVVGSDTIRLHYRLKYEDNWTIGEDRDGSGDIVQTGLIANSWYEIYVTSLVSDVESPPSAISTIRVLGTDDIIESALYSILSSDDTIVDLVNTRISPNIISQKTIMPAISFQQISGQRGYVMAGPDGTVESRYQINCWANTYNASKELSEAVRKKLSDFTGTVNSRKIELIKLEDEGDLPNLSPGVDVLRRYGKRLDFLIWYKETI